jgi:hypothetical protein
MAEKKRKDSKVKKPSEKKPDPAETNDWREKLMEASKRIKVIVAVNGKFESHLVETESGGWICQIWAVLEDGQVRPRIRNVKPFATKEEAIQMAQECFAKLTGDDRYFAKEDIWKENKPD